MPNYCSDLWPLRLSPIPSLSTSLSLPDPLTAVFAIICVDFLLCPTVSSNVISLISIVASLYFSFGILTTYHAVTSRGRIPDKHVRVVV